MLVPALCIFLLKEKKLWMGYFTQFPSQLMSGLMTIGYLRWQTRSTISSYSNRNKVINFPLLRKMDEGFRSSIFDGGVEHDSTVWASNVVSIMAKLVPILNSTSAFLWGLIWTAY